MKQVLSLVAIALVLAVVALLHEGAKKDAADIDVCSKKDTAEEVRQCRNAVEFAYSAGM
jgi:hypothetical protein